MKLSLRISGRRAPAVIVIAIAAAAASAADRVRPAIPVRVEAFGLQDVRLLESPFLHAMELNGAYLLKLEPDRLLHTFRTNAGLKPKGERYGGWEKDTIAGHSLGHYLSALALHYASTGDERFLKRANYIVDELSECQQAHGRGFVFGFPRGEEIFEELRQGRIRSRGFDLNGCWVPLYNLHKSFAGLLDAHALCGNQKALRVARSLGDFLIGVFGELDETQVQKILDCEHGGLNESFAELYAATGDRRYLAMAKRIYHKKVLDPLAAREDRLNGLHGNTQIPKVIGCARLYELTGDEKYGTIARFFWDTVVAHHTYANGGHGDNEYFGPPDMLSRRLGSTTETCNTYNMLKLTRHLFRWEPDPRYFDYYERALYNHILAHQHPKTGMYMYKGFLGMPARKNFSSPFDSFWCCVGTGMENHSKYGGSIYFHGEDSLYVVLYVPSVLTWREKGVTVRQEGGGERVTLRFECAAPAELSLNLRRPSWCRESMRVAVNGEALTSPGGPYFTVRRTWKTGDSVEVALPMKLTYESVPDDPRRVAFFYGPLLLCADLGASQEVPLLVCGHDEVLGHIAPAAEAPLTFSIKGVARPEGDVLLRPHFQVYEGAYSVYLDVLSREEWAARQAELEAEERRRAELASRTLDVLRVGEMQPERDHNLTSSERSYVGDYLDRKWRDARDGGHFEFDMKVDGGAPMDLLCEYWGGDRGRIFDVMIDGEVIATQKLELLKEGEFVEVVYPIPEKLTAGKEKVRVRLQGHPNRTAGGLFGCRTLRRREAE